MRSKAAVMVMVAGVALTTGKEARSQSRAWVAPAVSLSLSHDSNLFLTPNNAGDVLTQLRPSLEGAYESPTKEFYGAAWFDAQVSANYSSLNALAARRNGLIDARVRTSPNVFLGVDARYDRTDSPSELNLESGILLGRQEATRTQVTPSAEYRVGPRMWLRAQYDWTTESLSGYAQQSLHGARVGMDYSWSPLTQWGGRYVGRSFVGAPLDTRYSHALLVTLSRQLAPGANLSIQAGPRVRSYDAVTSEVLASFLRLKPRHRFLLDYWHGETIVLGVAGPVDIHSGTYRTAWLLRNDLEVSTLIGAFRSTAPSDLRAIVYHGGAGGSWRFRKMYALTIAYRADLQRGDLRGQLPPDDYAGRGVFLVGLTVAPRLTRPVRSPGFDPAYPITGVLWP
jgi:hypothetical protein